MHLTATRMIVALVVMAPVFSAVAAAEDNTRVTMGLATWKSAGCADCTASSQTAILTMTIFRPERICARLASTPRP
jgi:uncharacterized protein YfaP (DUF2135 family)